MEYDEVESVLYRLGQRAEPRYSRSRMEPRRGTPGPPGMSRQTERRVDVSHAVRRLSDDERQMVLDHYVTGRRQVAPRIRRPVVKKLLAALRGG